MSPSDIKQGLLGDCYFLSVLSVLTEKPTRITKLFLTDKQNNLGVYGIRICKNGEWKEVVVDDYDVYDVKGKMKPPMFCCF